MAVIAHADAPKRSVFFLAQSATRAGCRSPHLTCAAALFHFVCLMYNTVVLYITFLKAHLVVLLTLVESPKTWESLCCQSIDDRSSSSFSSSSSSSSFCQSLPPCLLPSSHFLCRIFMSTAAAASVHLSALSPAQICDVKFAQTNLVIPSQDLSLFCLDGLPDRMVGHHKGLGF